MASRRSESTQGTRRRRRRGLLLTPSSDRAGQRGRALSAVRAVACALRAAIGHRSLVLPRASESPPTAGACTDPANGRPVERSKQQSRRRRRSVPPLRNLSTLTRRTQTSAFTNRQNSQPPRKRRWRLLLSTGSSSAGRSCFRSAAGTSTGTGRALLRADSALGARERSAAKLDAPGAGQPLGCCKQESSSRAAGVALPLSGQRQSRLWVLRRAARC